MNKISEIFRTQASVGSDGVLSLEGIPFPQGQRVEVLVLPDFVAKPPRGLRDSMVDLGLRALEPRLDWPQVCVPDDPRGFEDLVFLFDSSPLNRGIILMDLDEAGALFKAVSGRANPRGMEIGRSKGGSTFLLAVAIGAGGKLTSIDIQPKNDAMLTDVLRRAALLDRVELIVADANTVDDGDGYDFVFVDGNHHYEAATLDHNRWGKRVTEGGLIIHHDMGYSRPFSTQWTDLARLKSDILERQQACVALVQEVGSVAIFRRISPDWVDV